MNLSLRLEAVLGMISPGRAVLDVGCDHAFVPVELVRRGISPFAVASDLRDGPLLAAREHIRNAELEGKIRVVLADGVPGDIEKILDDLSAETGVKAGTELVVAGMGGILVTEILQKAGEKLDLFSALVLSPQRDPDVLRRELRAVRFRIDDEVMIEEDGKFYPVIRAVPADCSDRGGRDPEREKCEDLYGPVLIRKPDAVLARLIRKEMTEYERILSALEREGLAGGTRASEIRKKYGTAERTLLLMGMTTATR